MLPAEIVARYPTFEHDGIALICGDCLEILPMLPAGSVDAVVTDPPYSSPTVNSFGREVVKRLSDLAIQEFYFKHIKIQFERLIKINSPILIFCDDAYYPVLFSLFYEWQQTNLLIWDKGKIGMGNPFRRQHELIFYANRSSIELNKSNLTHIPTILKYGVIKENHAAEKPLPLIEKIINGLSKQSSFILDPFMGSGTTGVACVQTGRNFIGIEIDEGYFNIAKRRIERTQMQPSLFEAQ